jgi:hypothetical protein
MATRFKSGSEDGVRSGYDAQGVPEDFTIPACSVEDVDRSLFQLFDQEINFQIETDRDGIVNVPVVFATGERFALVKRRKPLTDVNGVLILPMISIRRTGIRQTSQDITNRGINQHTGDLTVKRRLSTADRKYQQLINKFNIQNQKNVARSEADQTGEKIQTGRTIGESSEDVDITDGALLAPQNNQNIYEFITIPQPQFYVASYEITFYAQYIQHMNVMINTLMETYLPQGRQLKLETDKGYWFIARMGDSVTSDDTLSDFSEQERVVMSTIECEVNAYVIPGEGLTDRAPVRRYLSAPQINFEIYEDVEDFYGKNEDPYRSADDPTDNFLLTQEINPAKRESTTDKRLKYTVYSETVKNPFTNEDEERIIRKVSVDNSIGETVFKET